jgi:hypothetical protein
VELFQLSTLIERLLADQRRMIAVRTKHALGEPCAYSTGAMGRYAAAESFHMGYAKVALHKECTPREWTLPYGAVEPPKASAVPRHSGATSVAARRLVRGQVRAQVGIVVRINQRAPQRSKLWTVIRGGSASRCFGTHSTSDQLIAASALRSLESRGP